MAGYVLRLRLAPTLTFRSVTESCHFYKLPRELRDQILYYVCGDQSIKLHRKAYDKTRLHSTVLHESPVLRPAHDRESIDCHDTSMNILLTCRLVAKEAAIVIYSTTTFSFIQHEPFLAFLATLPTKYLRMISMVKMSLFLRVSDQRVSLLQDAIAMNPLLRLQSLSYLTITFTLDEYYWGLGSQRFHSKTEKAWSSSEVLPKLKFANIRIKVGTVGIELGPFMEEVRDLRQDLMDGSVSQRTRKVKARILDFETFREMD